MHYNTFQSKKMDELHETKRARQGSLLIWIKELVMKAK
jgi:hypothetical protein